MLSVGEVIYLLDKKTQALVPCMVVEKVNSVSLQGETTHHVVKTPSGKTLKIEDYKSPWFNTIEDAKSFLMSAAKKLVEKSAESALKVAQEVFNLPSQDSSLEPPQDESILLQDAPVLTEEIVVDLGNGQKAKVTMPEIAEVS